jgi:hypothetical protein
MASTRYLATSERRDGAVMQAAVLQHRQHQKRAVARERCKTDQARRGEQLAAARKVASELEAGCNSGLQHARGLPWPAALR